ncbi:MAG: ABC transporter substrate-binding protein [Betaproteobacteria bacterium]|nr:ABC transporter substrate-binding protein [Betaproteobacteria bacterium]MBI2959067.1 ABC transporter substrate-binding protein [Betaproteobacteria bacterium]
MKRSTIRNCARLLAARALAAAALAALTAVFSPIAHPAAPAKKIALKTAFTNTGAASAPLWAAQDGGYFAEEGLEVTIARIQAGAPVMAAIQNGEVPIGYIGANSVIEANLRGASFVIVGGFMSRLGYKLYTIAAVERAEQLKGKALGTSNFGSITHVAGQVATEHLGIKDAVKYIQTGGQPETLAAMKAGIVQGGAFQPPEDLKAKEAGFRELVDVGAIGVAFQTSAITSTRKWARENPEVIERYLRALIKATHRLRTDKEFAIATIAKNSRTDNRQILETAYSYFADKWTPDGIPSTPGMERVLHFIAAKNPAAQAAKPEQFMDLTIANRIKQSGLVEKLYKGK